MKHLVTDEIPLDQKQRARRGWQQVRVGKETPAPELPTLRTGARKEPQRQPTQWSEQDDERQADQGERASKRHAVRIQQEHQVVEYPNADNNRGDNRRPRQ